MKRFYSLFFLLIFIVFSCKGTPKNDQGSDDSGLSQLELTAEEAQAEAGFDDESRPDEDMLAQGGMADDSEIAENLEAETDDIQADARIEEQQLVVEEMPVPAPRITPVPPPVVTAIEERPAEQSAQEEQTAVDESTAEQKPPPRIQPLVAPPPAVMAVKDDAPVPNQRLLVPPKLQKEDEIIFSRTVRVTAGQIVEIPFRGTGWIYLGELTSRRGLVYNSRRLDPEGQSFIFTAEEAGTYSLKFYRQDFIRDFILNDYVQVIVGEPPSGGGAGWFNPPIDRGRVTAEPRWPSALDESAILRGGQAGIRPAAAESTPENKNDSSSAQPAAPVNRESAPAPSTAAPQVVTPQTLAPQIDAPEIPQTAEEMPAIEKQEKLPPEEMLKKAQETFNEGNNTAAIALLDQFMEYYPDGSDELYWLYGQFYEANTTHRNIKLSLDYYRRLVDEYPQSRRYNDARRRIAYLERFYINIQ